MCCKSHALLTNKDSTTQTHNTTRDRTMSIICHVPPGATFVDDGRRCQPFDQPCLCVNTNIRGWLHVIRTTRRIGKRGGEHAHEHITCPRTDLQNAHTRTKRTLQCPKHETPTNTHKTKHRGLASFGWCSERRRSGRPTNTEMAVSTFSMCFLREKPAQG